MIAICEFVIVVDDSLLGVPQVAPLRNDPGDLSALHLHAVCVLERRFALTSAATARMSLNVAQHVQGSIRRLLQPTAGRPTIADGLHCDAVCNR